MSVFGPLFRHELTRLARRGLQPKLRAGFAGALLVALLVTYLQAFPGVPAAAVLTRAGRPMTIEQAATFAERFFVAFLVVQLLVVSVVTPVLAAGAVTDERDRGTLDFLLSSPLSNAEIVAGKLAARLAFMAGLLLTGLPVLVLTMFFGGVDGPQLLAGYAITLASVASVGALSLLLAVRGKSLGGVLARVYLLQFGLAGFGFCYACCVAPAFLSPFGALLVLVHGWGVLLTPNNRPDVPWLVGPYLALHLGAAAYWLGQAARRVRSPETGEQPEPFGAAYRPPRDDDLPPLPAAPREFSGVLPAKATAPLGDGDPFAWKEACFGAGVMPPAESPVYSCLFAVLACGFLVSLTLQGKPHDGDNPLLRALFVAPLSAVVIGVGVLACGSVARERQAGTLVALLTLPVPRIRILRAKARSAVAAWWLAYTVAAGFLVVALVTGALLPVSAVTLPLTCAGWLAFAAGAGLWLSVRSPVPARATGALVGALVCLSVFPPLLGPLFGRGAHWLDGLSPAVGLWHAVPTAWMWHSSGENAVGRALGAVCGAAGAAVVGWACWRLALRRFEAIGE